MAFVLGNVGRVLANGYAVSSTVSGWQASMQRALSEVTTLPDGGTRYVPGLSAGMLTLMGPQDSTGQNLHSQVASAVGVDNSIILSVFPYGTAAGSMAMTCLGDLSEWTIDAATADAVRFQLTTMADEMVDAGFIVHGLSAETATGNSASIDRVLPSSNGGTAVLHVTAYATLTNAVIKIQHSTDNSTWADLVTFVTTTAISAQRLSIAPGTAVNRYVRATVTVTGSGSVTYLVALEPR